jgi:hypothetical protein
MAARPPCGPVRHRLYQGSPYREGFMQAPPLAPEVDPRALPVGTRIGWSGHPERGPTQCCSAGQVRPRGAQKPAEAQGGPGALRTASTVLALALSASVTRGRRGTR